MQGRISLSLSLSLVKVKVKFTQTEVYKDSPLEKIDPLRSNPAPSPTVPLLHCPHGPSMPRFSPPLQTLHPSDNQGRASTSHVGGLAALLVLKVVLIGKGTRTHLDVDKDCDDGDPLLHRLATIVLCLTFFEASCQKAMIDDAQITLKVCET